MPRWRELAGEIVDTPPIGVEASIGGSGVDPVGSARDQLVKTHPRLQGKRVALIGFRVRHGDVIDALTPIYAEVTETLELVGEYEGKRIGGTGANRPPGG